MKKALHKSLALLLTLCMLLTLLPAAALAVGGDGELGIAGGILDTDYSVSGSTINILTSQTMAVSDTTTTEHIVVGSGVTANLTFDGVSIKVTDASPISIEAGGTLNITLTGTNSLRGYKDTGSGYFPAIFVPKGATLNISGTGSLSAVAEANINDVVEPAYCYAIGAERVFDGDPNLDCGAITISQATVTANAYAGIGGIGADVAISDGANVSLQNTSYLGIGGNDTAGTPDPASVSISGSSTVVRAVMAANGDNSTGIAIGGEGCAVNISGGTIKAVGHDAGIGGDRSTVTVSGGTVTATGTGTVGIGGDNCTVDISGTSTVVKAYGRNIGIGSDYYNYSSTTQGAYDITISGGDVTAWTACDFSTSDYDWAATYNDGYLGGSYWGIGGNLGCDAVGNIAISGGTVDARGYHGGIGGNCGADSANEHSTAAGSLTIDISGGNVNAVATVDSDNYGIGGNLYSGDSRSITISGNAIVSAWGGFNNNGYYGGSIIGGGDCTDSVITIKDNAKVVRASTIGGSGATPSSGDNRVGHTGGVINILGNASVGEDSNGLLAYNTGADHIGGSMDDYVIQGGDGGTITINTTGVVGATSIGGGDASYSAADCNGGAGGAITISNGMLLVNHIGGGNGISESAGYKGYGGAGGTINIFGGTFKGLEAKVSQYSDSERYYASAGIGGGGGTHAGGSGGTITISGGTMYAYSAATVYGSGTGVGAAGIGGGNGADGGTITISGGRVEAYARVSPSGTATASALPALIGGGSAGGAGNITISGGDVFVNVTSQDCPAYGDDSTSIGQGKGYNGADGWVKVTGGSLEIPISTYHTTVARPAPWPVSAADGSTRLYPVRLPSSVDSVSYAMNSELISMTIKKASGGETYTYGIKDLKPGSYIWLPIEEDISSWGSESHTLYNITLSIKKDNTTYGFTGTISYFTNSNYIEGITGSCDLTCTGEIIESLQITSDWGGQTKIYDGTDQMPNFTVKNMAGDTLTKDTDYTLKIEYAPNDGYGVRVETDIIKNAGGYYVTATGVAGTAYEGMTATLDVLWINPKEITGVYSGTTFTKQYDGTTNVYDGATEVESITLTVNGSDLCTGDALSNIVATNPRYKTSGVGSGIEIDANGPDYTYTQNSAACNIFNYNIALPTTLKGNITVKVIGETNLDATGVTVTKVYDGTTNCALTNVSGDVVLKNLVGTEVATVNITGVSAFDSANAGARTVTLTIGSLAGVNSANYTLVGGASTVTVNATITPFDYKYNLTLAQQTQEYTQGGGIAQISLPQTAEGVNSETVTGAVTLWHDLACTANQATDTSVNALTVGNHNLYVKFVPDASETNYDTTKITTGKVVVLTVVEGDPQNISFATPAAVSKTYGDSAFTNLCTNSSTNGGEITYASGDTSVAEVNETTGEVTIKGAGTAVITATAAKVEGQYRATSINYTLTVSKKAVTVTANDDTRKFGEANPAFSLANLSGVLVSGDSEASLGVTLSTVATASSNVGTYDITGTSTSANYNVTVTAGTLTINKADAPTVSAVNKNLLYSEAHTDVAVTINGLPADCGTTSFAAGAATGDTGIINGTVTNTVNGIQFSTNIGTENQTATIPVTVTMQNYENTTVNVVVKLVNKTPVTITGVTIASKTYDGAAAAYTGTPANEQGYTGTYEYVWSSSTAPKNVGSYTLTVKISEDNADFMGEAEIPFEISRKALTAKPKNISIYNGAALPTSFVLEYTGLVSGDTITPTGTPEFALKDGSDTLTSSSKNGTYTIEWTNKDAVTVEHANYTVTKANGTLTISAQPSGGDGGGAAAPATPSTPSVTTENGVSKATVEAKTETSGTAATATVSSGSMKTAIEAAQKAAEDKKTASSVEIKAAAPSGATEIGFDLPKEALSTFAGSNAETLSLNSSLGQLNLSAKTVESIAKQAEGADVVMSLAKVDTEKTLNEQQREAVGTAPVYDISITSGGKNITSFDGGTATVTLPYELKAGEDPAGIVVWYLDAQGNIQKMETSYDPATKSVTFTTTHFSLYVVGYNAALAWNNPFTDVSKDAWYYDAVHFVNQQGMMKGDSATAFLPEAAVTRGMLVTILYRLEGSPAMSGTSFTDVIAGEWYSDAVSWAAVNGIAAGYGEDKFGPEDEITREQMAVMLMNYAKFKGYDISADESSLSAFSDSTSVSSWAISAMKWAGTKKIITGDSGGILDPAGSATRAQAATILMRFCNLLIK